MKKIKKPCCLYLGDFTAAARTGRNYYRYLVKFKENTGFVFRETIFMVRLLRWAIIQIIDYKWTVFSLSSWTIITTLIVFILFVLIIGINCLKNQIKQGWIGGFACIMIQAKLPFKYSSTVSCQYFMLSGRFDLYQISVLPTLASGGIGRNPSPVKNCKETKKKRGNKRNHSLRIFRPATGDWMQWKNSCQTWISSNNAIGQLPFRFILIQGLPENG